MIARETGWSIEYILSLPEYWRRIMLGWTPVLELTPEEKLRNAQEMAAQMAQMITRHGGPKRGQRRF